VRFLEWAALSAQQWRLLAAMGWPGAGRSALQRRIVAALIVENEAWPFGEVLVESPGGLSLSEGR
jgi:hypothetical protein